MLELIPFTEADIDRLAGWTPSLEEHLFWTASGFEYPLPREPFARFLRESAERGRPAVLQGRAPREWRALRPPRAGSDRPPQRVAPHRPGAGRSGLPRAGPGNG